MQLFRPLGSVCCVQICAMCRLLPGLCSTGSMQAATSHSMHDAAPLSSGLRTSVCKQRAIIMKSIPQQLGAQGSIARPCYLPRLCVLRSRCRSRSQAPHLQTRAIDRSMSLAAVTESHGLTKDTSKELVRNLAMIKGQLSRLVVW